MLALASPSLGQDRLRIVTTTTDLRSLAEAVGGERVDVTNLVPPNVDAEEYQPKPQDVVRLKDARVVVRVGLDFDLWFDRLLSQVARMQPNVDALRRGGTGHVDASLAIAMSKRDRLYFSKSRESRESSWATKDIRPAAERLAVPTTAL